MDVGYGRQTITPKVSKIPNHRKLGLGYPMCKRDFAGMIKLWAFLGR